MITLDRMLLINFLRSYAIVFTSLLTLYIVIDLFTNLDDFAGKGSLYASLKHIGQYYSVRVLQIFDRLSEAITLIAAVFTVSWMQRNNELLPQLSAGVSTQRVVRPVLIGAGAMLVLGPMNQELVIPRIADELMVPRDDPQQQRPIEMRGGYDPSGVHVEAFAGYRRDQRVTGLSVTFPETGSAGMAHIQAEEAVWSAKESGWYLYNTIPETMPDPLPEQLKPLGPRRYFLSVRQIDFDSLTRGSSMYPLASTAKLRQMLDSHDTRRLAPVAVIFHMRYTRPLVGIILVLLGLAIILRNQNRHILVSAGLCLVMGAVFYAVVYGCKYLGEQDVLAAPLAAWLPVILVGPIAVVQYDAMHT